MKLFFTHKEIALKKKRTALVVIGIGLVIGIYLIVSHQPAKMPELPVVAIAPATQDDVEIYGEYVGRVRAQQFVEVRARVEGYLEQMLFAEGTYVTKNQVGTLHWKGLEFVRHCIAGAQSGLASGAFFDGYLILLGILAVNSICDRNRLRRAVRAEKIVMEPADEAVRTAVFGKYTLTEEQKKKLTNQLIIEVHFALSLIAMLFAHLLMYKMTEGSKHFLTFIAAGIFIVSMLETKYYKKAVLLGAAFLYLYSYKAVEPYDYQVPYVTQGRQEQIAYWSEVFAEKVSVDTEQVPDYKNVVIWTLGDVTEEGNQSLKWQLLYGTPKGFGISCCEFQYVSEHLTELESRYVATVSGGIIDGMCQAQGYEELGRDADMVLYQRY